MGSPSVATVSTPRQRYARIVASGETMSWEKMRRYLEGKATGKVTRRPAPRKLAK